MLYVVVSPSLAFLDQAIPLSFHFKVQKPEEPIEFVFPKLKTTRQLNSEWLPIRIAEEIGSMFHFPVTEEIWISTASIGQTRHLSKIFGPLTSLIERYSKFFPPYLRKLIDRVVLFALKLMRVTATNGFSGHSSGSDWSLIDIYIIEKPYFEAVAKVVKNSNVLSISHGLNPFQGHKLKNRSSASWLRARDGLGLIVCAQSARELPVFLKSFNIKESAVLVTGVPRHHPDWIEHISKKTAHTAESGVMDTILLVSAPAEPPGSFLSKNRKETYIETVRDFAIENGLKILVKRHPKEFREKVYERVLGKQGKGAMWDFTEAHALESQTTVIFAVTFFSSLCVDLIQLRIPTIEIRRFRESPEFNSGATSQDEVGNTDLDDYRRFGLVVSVNSAETFFSAGKLVMRDRKLTIERLQKNYAKTYLHPPLSPAQVIKEALSSG